MKLENLVGGIVVLIFMVVIPEAMFGARPLATDDAGTVEEGNFELEIGYDFGVVDAADQSLGASLKAGLTSVLDFGFSVPYDIGGDMGEVELGTKFAVFGGKGFIPAFAVSFAYTPGTFDYALCFIATEELDPCAFHLNLGFVRSREGQEVLISPVYAGACEFSLLAQLAIVGEVVGEGDDLDVLVGARCQPLEWVAIDGGIACIFVDSTMQWSGTAGFTFGF